MRPVLEHVVEHDAVEGPVIRQVIGEVPASDLFVVTCGFGGCGRVGLDPEQAQRRAGQKKRGAEPAAAAAHVEDGRRRLRDEGDHVVTREPSMDGDRRGWHERGR